MKKLVLFVWIIFSFLPLEAEILSEQIPAGNRNFLAIRVEFQEDNTYLTTGNGKFMTSEWTGHDTTYTLDPLPHDRSYFSSHLTFINNYWTRASDSLIGINTQSEYLIPENEQAYVLTQAMRYYSDPDSLDYRLALLVYETVMLAVDSGEYISDHDGVIIYHAGAGQDFNIDLDNSPFDIPSFYFDENYLLEYLPYNKYSELVSVNCLKGVVLPESQNQLNVNIALNGTEILLTGMLLGLPTLYDTEYGRSGAGTFGLMDQGSNTGSGLLPIKPSAFERYLLGAEEPIKLTRSDTIRMLRDEIYKLPVSSNEYFLMEFRKNAGIWTDSLYYSRNNLDNYLDVLRVLDSLELIDYTIENGVLTDISDLDVGLPTDGILIWHIVEPEFFGENPNAQDNWFLNLVEADGGDDIGKWYGTFDPSVNNGYKWDMWFANNEGYKDNNPSSYKMQFNDTSHPNSRSKEGLSTGINIRDFKFYPDSAVIQLVMDSPLTYNYDGMVFDEMTRAAGGFDHMDNLIGYRDSSIYLRNSMGLFRLFTNSEAYEKGKTAFITYDSDIIQVTNDEVSATVKHLYYNPTFIQVSDTLNIGHPVDLDHIALHGDTLFLPPLSVVTAEGSTSPLQLRNVYKLDIPSWSLLLVDEGTGTFVPYVMNGHIEYVEAAAAALMNGELIYSDNYGFTLEKSGSTILPEDWMSFDIGQHLLQEIIPLHMNHDGEFEILALTEFDENNTLSAFLKTGPLLNSFPVFENYMKIRVYKLGGEPLIAAYDPSGKIDILDTDATKLLSMPAPVNAASFFIEQVKTDTAWIIADGSIYAVESDEVYWGYKGKDALHSNAVTEAQSAAPLSSDKLIYQDLIYNYPNPAEGDRTKFRFFSTGATHASVNIYALNGSFIQTLDHEVNDQQWNEIIWNVTDVESGVYIAKIEISDGTKTETYFVKPAILK